MASLEGLTSLTRSLRLALTLWGTTDPLLPKTDQLDRVSFLRQNRVTLAWMPFGSDRFVVSRERMACVFNRVVNIEGAFQMLNVDVLELIQATHLFTVAVVPQCTSCRPSGVEAH